MHESLFPDALQSIGEYKVATEFLAIPKCFVINGLQIGREIKSTIKPRA